MEFAKRMDRFGEGVFSMLAQMKNKKIEEGGSIVDLSIGAPNIPPAPHILKALSEECLKPENYLYAIQDHRELLEAVAQWYERRYGVSLDPDSEICSLLGSQEGLSHIARPLLMRAIRFWFRIPVIRYLQTARPWPGRPFIICLNGRKIITSLI